MQGSWLYLSDRKNLWVSSGWSSWHPPWSRICGYWYPDRLTRMERISVLFRMRKNRQDGKKRRGGMCRRKRSLQMRARRAFSWYLHRMFLSCKLLSRTSVKTGYLTGSRRMSDSWMSNCLPWGWIRRVRWSRACPTLCCKTMWWTGLPYSRHCCWCYMYLKRYCCWKEGRCFRTA